MLLDLHHILTCKHMFRTSRSVFVLFCYLLHSDREWSCLHADEYADVISFIFRWRIWGFQFCALTLHLICNQMVWITVS